MPAERQKLRQTCDPCRKAKVKCNKKSPICSRCLASGAPCDYGVSNRGGRWKNGQKMGVRRVSFEAPRTPEPTNALVQTYSPELNTMMPFHTEDSAVTRWQDSQDNDIWAYAPTSASSTSSFQQYSPAPTPTAHSSSSSLSSFWPGEFHTEAEQSQKVYPTTMTSPFEKPIACSCLVVMLQMLQNLHQNFPQSSSSQLADFSALSYAAILDMNEEATICCTTMLRCPSCQSDDSSDFFIVLAALIRKVLSLTEAWVASPYIGDIGESGGDSQHPFVGGHATAQEDDRRLKVDVSLIGIEKMKGVLMLLKQAGLLLRQDYERLTCTSLTVSLSARLKSALDRVGGERSAGVPE